MSLSDRCYVCIDEVCGEVVEQPKWFRPAARIGLLLYAAVRKRLDVGIAREKLRQARFGHVATVRADDSGLFWKYAPQCIEVAAAIGSWNDIVEECHGDMRGHNIYQAALIELRQRDGLLRVFGRRYAETKRQLRLLGGFCKPLDLCLFGRSRCG